MSKISHGQSTISNVSLLAGCYYNFQHYGEGDRIMTNEPCLNCTCHNRMLMCYLRVCPFTKPIGQDCTVEKRDDQCCPIITCPDGNYHTESFSYDILKTYYIILLNFSSCGFDDRNYVLSLVRFYRTWPPRHLWLLNRQKVLFGWC